MPAPADHGDHDGHAHAEAKAATADDDHGAPGHLHDDPADRGKRWFLTAKGKLVIVTGLLLAAAWAVN